MIEMGGKGVDARRVNDLMVLRNPISGMPTLVKDPSAS